MAIAARQAVSVTTSATRLDQDPTDSFGGSGVIIAAKAAGTLILGPAGVTSANGCRIPVVDGSVITVDLDAGETLYGIVASGSLAVDVLVGGA